MRHARIALLATLVVVAPTFGNGATSEQQAADAALMSYLRATLKPSHPTFEETSATATKVQVAWVDLNADKRPEAIVYVEGRGWCGSGGCRLLVLEQDGDSFRTRARLSVTRPPIALLSERSSGWRKLTVYIAGGGIIPGYRVVVPFDGSQYARNPTMPPAYKLAEGVEEQVVIGGVEFPFLGR